MPDPHASAVPRTVNALRRINGVFIIIGALAIGAIGWFALANLAENIRKNPEIAKDIAPLALQCIEHRAWLPALALPPLVCGIVLLASKRGRGSFWLLFGLSSIWLFALFGLILYCFLMFLAPLYQYQPL